MSFAEDIAHITVQERELQFPAFDLHTAWALGSWLRGAAAERGHALVVDIRRFDQPLFYAALPGTTPDNPDWVRRKSNLVARFHRSSYRIGLELQLKNTTVTEKYALPARDYASHGGSFPLTVANAGVIGSITVSGLPQRQDHELVVEALCTQLGKSYETLRLAD